MPKRMTSGRGSGADPALVAGFIALIRNLSGFKSLNMLFRDLEILERNERGARRRAIRHIRENVAPKALGLRVAYPEPRGPHPSHAIAKAFADLYAPGKSCPLCKRRKIMANADGNGTSCPRCGRLTWSTTIPRERHSAVSDFLRRMHEDQILGMWRSLNDPNPIRFAARAA